MAVVIPGVGRRGWGWPQCFYSVTVNRTFLTDRGCRFLGGRLEQNVNILGGWVRGGSVFRQWGQRNPFHYSENIINKTHIVTSLIKYLIVLITNITDLRRNIITLNSR